LRGKRSLEMELDTMEGIGPKRKQQLLQHFGSLEKIRHATKEELQSQIGSVQGDKLYDRLHPEHS
jgi:excinuclease ABC subunit C